MAFAEKAFRAGHDLFSWQQVTVAFPARNLRISTDHSCIALHWAPEVWSLWHRPITEHSSGRRTHLPNCNRNSWRASIRVTGMTQPLLRARKTPCVWNLPAKSETVA